jgi:hypothetical protein
MLCCCQYDETVQWIDARFVRHHVDCPARQNTVDPQDDQAEAVPAAIEV